MARRLILAGGGTAGHVLPLIAIAEALVADGWSRDDLCVVGSERGIETRLVPEAGFELVALPGRGIQRRVTKENLAAAHGLEQALVAALREVRRRHPVGCVSVGGYASLAGALACAAHRVPIVVAEQNARASAANRLIGRLARACAVPFPGTDLPHAVVTGTPVRPEVVARRDDPRRSAERSRLAVGDRRLVLVFAGSLGATRINDSVEELVELWSDRDDLLIHHVIGPRDFDARPRLPRRGAGLRYEPVRYEDDLPAVMAAADLAVCRAGGSTVAELTVIGLGAVLVPLPIATRDHQAANAGALVDADAAVMVRDDDLDPGRLAFEIERALAPGRAEAMARAARSIGRPDAARDIAALVERNVGGGSP